MDIRQSFWKVLVDTHSEIHQSVEDITTQALGKKLPGVERTELRKVFTPKYPPNCKRILISDDCYSGLAHAHVTLETAHISCIPPAGIVDRGGRGSAVGRHETIDYSFDLLACAIGSQATQYLIPPDVRVKGKGMSLHEEWEKTDTQANLAMTIPGFPTSLNLGHSCIILMIEAQSAYINRLIVAVCWDSDGNPAACGTYLSKQPRPDASHAWISKVRTELRQTTLAS